ncbi:MAG: GAF domain-containing protein, partial [Armatimonadetes bacterium]|nr:GAF domain-containing protein [Armatimonadota bacterium]
MSAPRLPRGVDPLAEQERLQAVSSSRADSYEVQADFARDLVEHLGRTTEELRQLDLLQHDLHHLSLPHYALLDLTNMIRNGASMEDLLQRVLEEAVRLFEAEKSSILVPGEDGQALRVAAARSLSGSVRADFTIGVEEGVAGRAFTSGQRLVIDNTARCDYYLPGREGSPEPKYLVAVPLEAEGEKLGVLCLERPVSLPAPLEKVEQLHAFAFQAALQLRNVRAFERLMRQVGELSILCDISRELSSSLQHEALLQKIVSSASTLLECSICSLMLFEDDKTTLRIRHAVGLPDEVVANAVARPGEGVTGWVAECGEPLLIEDITKDERFKPRGGRSGKYNTRSLLSVPLKIGTEVVGVVN